MKKLHFLGVIIPLFIIAVSATFVSCSKSDSAGGGSGPIVIPPQPPAPTFTMTSPPANPLDFGSNFNGTCSVKDYPEGATFYKDGILQATMSGTVALVNLQVRTVIQFELKSSTGVSLKKDSLVLSILSKDQTDIKNLGPVSLIKAEVAQDTVGALFIDQGSINVCLADDKYTFNPYDGKCYFDRSTIKCDSIEFKTGWSPYQFHQNWLEWANSDPTSFFQFNIGETQMVLTRLHKILNAPPATGFHWGRERLTYSK